MKNIFSKNKVTISIAIIALLIIIIAINLVSEKIYFRADITESKLYSLSSGTEKLLSSLPEDVTLKLFYSSSLKGVSPRVKLYAKRVEDILKEYQNHSDGALFVEYIDPKIDSVEEEWAQKYGVMGNQINPLIYDELLYFGLVAEALDASATIPLLNPQRERYLEYDISQLIYQVLNPQKKSIGILSSLPITGNSLPAFMLSDEALKNNTPPWLLTTELEKIYNVHNISTNITAIGIDIDVLLVIHPVNLSLSTMFAIDQYVMKGGKAIFFVDPFCVMDQKIKGGYLIPSSSGLNKLFNSWGFNVSENFVALDMINGTPISVGPNQVQISPLWISATGNMFNDDQVACANLGNMLFPGVGGIQILSNCVADAVQLVSTSTNSMLFAKQFALRGGDYIKQKFVSQDMPIVLATKISGPIKSAFMNNKSKQPIVKGTTNTIVIVADVDMLADKYNLTIVNMYGQQSYQQINNNYDFVMNSIDQLAGDVNLISIRSKSNVDRPFTVVKELERKAQEKYFEKEKQLELEYEQVRQAIIELESTKDDSQKMIISPEQQEEIENWKKQKVELAQELKEVRKSLNHDKEQLGLKLKIFNLALMPAIVCIFGIVLAIYRKYKVKK